MIAEHKLNITGDRPFALFGEEIITESTWAQDATRWWKVTIFTSYRKKKAGGGIRYGTAQWEFLEYVVGIAHITCFKQTERDRFWVDQVSDKEGILKVIQKHVPELVDTVSRQMNTLESFAQKTKEDQQHEPATRSPVE